MVVPVIQYLSEEWLSAAGEAIQASKELQEASVGADVTVAYEVTGTPSGKVAYGISLTDGTAKLVSEAMPDAQTTFSLDYDTAVQIAKGELSAQAAFMQGRMKLGGDVTLLIEHYRIVDGLADTLGALRSQTEF